MPVLTHHFGNNIQFSFVGRQFACDQCEKTYLRKAHLKTHKLSVHQGIRPHACDQCERRFFTAAVLLRHHLARHVHSVKNSFVCEQCSKSFPSKRYLKAHQRTHAGMFWQSNSIHSICTWPEASVYFKWSTRALKLRDGKNVNWP